MKLLHFFFLFWALLPPGFSQIPVAPKRGDIDLETMMPQDQFQRAGLSKLSPDELQVLENWLNGYVEVEATKAAEVAVEERKEVIKEETRRAFGFLSIWDKNDQAPEELKGPDYIESSIPGKFRGWRGETRFELENGQVWVQQGRERYSISLQDPQVRVEKGLLGAHYMRILDTGRRVKVRRIQ